MNSMSSCPSVVPFQSTVEDAVLYYKKAYLKVAKSHDERSRRVPVTQQFIASCLAAESRGITVNHPAKHFFPNALHDSIAKMVGMICSKYAVTCHADENDLVQDCFLRITKRIGTFNAKKSKFSTWCWKVCSSTLNSRYRGHLRYTSRFADGENIEECSRATEDASVLVDDIADTIREIAAAHPAKKKILYAMLGNPDKKDFCLPHKVKIASVVKDTGVKYGDAYLFYKNVVRKAFKERFSIEMNSEQ